MKIAILRKKYTFHGGSEGFSQNLLLRLARAGNEVHIYSIAWAALPSDNVFFHKVPAVSFNSFLRDLTFAVSSFFLLKKRRSFFDIIQSHDKTLYQDVYRAGDGCHIEWLRQRWKRCGVAGRLSILFNPYHWLILGMERMIFKGHRFRKVVAISEMVKKNIIEHYKVRPDDIDVIFNGVDLDVFHPDNKKKFRDEIRKKHGLADSEFVVLFMGSGFERKGVAYLMDAVASLSEPVTLLVAGRGKRSSFSPPFTGGDRRVSSQTRHRILFCGPQKDNFKYYAAADVFVSPSIYEPFGNVHLEALASGLPVITTLQSGASEIIESGKQGFVVDRPENTSEMAASITQLMDRDTNQRMASEARILAETFSFDAHLNNTLAMYREVMAMKSS